MPTGGADRFMTFLLDRSIIRHPKAYVSDTVNRGQQFAQRHQRLYRNHRRAQRKVGADRIGHPCGNANQPAAGEFAE
jgi:hypothetical protein